MIIPLQAVPAQRLSVTLSGKNCNISLRQKGAHMYIWINIEGSAVVDGIICRTGVNVVSAPYNGLPGNLRFEGDASDPQYTGIGTTWSLHYD